MRVSIWTPHFGVETRANLKGVRMQLKGFIRLMTTLCEALGRSSALLNLHAYLRCEFNLFLMLIRNTLVLIQRFVYQSDILGT